MATYLAPGVYVEEVPSSAAPIAGVSTSTAGFIGMVAETVDLDPVTGVALGTGNGTKTEFDLPQYPVDATSGSFEVRVDGDAVTTATIEADDDAGVARVKLATAPVAGEAVVADYTPQTVSHAADRPKLCTTWTDFVKGFGDFTAAMADEHRWLAHAVYGFFENGGSRCFVARVDPPAPPTPPTDPAPGPDIQAALEAFEAVDEIAIVAAPGMTGVGEFAADIRGAIATHCSVQTGDRFGIFDSPRDLPGDDLAELAADGDSMPDSTDHAAYYFPWIEVLDPGLGQRVFTPPSGHIAGLYARVDARRGVHKAPANEVVMGARGLRYAISKAQQAGLNPQGVNVIRDLNGNIRAWGARTVGGDANGEWKYVPIRRLFLFLRESIDEGTQWTVFEPNTPALWAKITRNVNAFLTSVWRDGALLGSTPEEAFYVRCNADTNPPDVRDAGRVVTEVGVAVIKPAEFVIFRISQWAGPGS